MKTIVIYSYNRKEWFKYQDFLWHSYKEAEEELVNPENRVVLASRQDNTDKECYFELVTEEFFDTFKKPYS